MPNRRRPRALLAGCAAVLAAAGALGGIGPARAAAPHRTADLLASDARPALGLNANLDDLSTSQRLRVLGQLAGMGATWLREGVDWAEVQPRAGELDADAVARVGATVSAAKAAGLRVLLTADNEAPDWARTGSAQDLSDAYGDLAGRLAAHFRGQGPGGVSPAYELMNEPNDGEAGSGLPDETPAVYAQAACSAYGAIHAADSGTTVAAGALNVSHEWQTWLTATFQAGLGGCFDVLSAHPYSGPSVLDEIRSLAADEGSPDTTIWVTEFGATTCTEADQGCVSEDDQASIIIDNLNQLQQSYPWVPVAIVYEACDTLDYPTARERSFGVFRSTTTARPCTAAKPAVAAITDFYGG